MGLARPDCGLGGIMQGLEGTLPVPLFLSPNSGCRADALPAAEGTRR